MYAIIEDSGGQVKVSTGDVIEVDLRDLPADADSLVFDRVLAIGDVDGEPGFRLGTPVLEGARVSADILAEDSTKVTITKFKRRKNYRRRKGHRQHFLRVRITGIEG